MILSLALAAPLAAQTTETPATDETATEQPAATGEQAPESNLGLSMAESEDGVGQPYVKEEIDDWALQCIRTENGEDPCQLYQLLKDQDGNPVAEFSLFKVSGSNQAVAGATIVVPLETMLTEDLMIGVDGAKGKRYRFSFCNTVGCFARIGLTEEDVNAFKRGNLATLTIVPFAAPDVKVRLNLSLKGFTNGYALTTEAPKQ
ncbi:invasion associated locus B family protein [Pseudooceanicola sp. 216_PA32_1]|uniref:Invasion associated locus B family protein n=2 Tax=Pseudooceanicola pacificus TaxID=2676438 RepID=A0A844W907_9RHOB|nr:invasion associated locus B family protein [Pseudooceanicola pacificus]